MNILKKYIWLVDTVMRAGNKGLTLRQIAERYEHDENISEGEHYARRTFQRHRDEVRDLFGIEIECYLDGTEHRYRITDATGDEYFQRWLLNSIAASRIVADSREVAQNIYVEPVQDTFLPILLEALKGNHTLKFNYQPFWKETPYHYHGVQPYALKMFERRWYLIARRDTVYRFFSLDRMSNVELLDDTFRRDPNFNMEEKFAGCYGIIVEDIPVESVRIKVDAYQANFLRSLPLHPSQHELKRTDEYSIFSLRVRPSLDFKQKILSFGSTVEVLQPESLREEMKAEITAMQKKYK